MYSAWQGWRAHIRLALDVRADARRFKLMETVISRLRRRVLSCVFADWLHVAQLGRRQRTVLLQFCARCGVRRLNTSFRAWQWHVRDVAEAAHAEAARAALAEHAQERTIARIVRQWQHRLQSSAFSGWQSHASWASSSRVKLRRCLARWNSRCAVLIMVGWASYARNTARARRSAEHEQVNSQLRGQLEKCAQAMSNLLASASVTGRTVPQMAAAVADAERLAARGTAKTGPGAQFEDCTFKSCDFRPASELPVTPVKSPAKPAQTQGFPSSWTPSWKPASGTASRTAAMEALSPSTTMATVASDETVVGEVDRTFVGRRAPTSGSDGATPPAEAPAEPGLGPSPAWSASPVHDHRGRKNAALHARLVKSGFYSAAAKVKPLYSGGQDAAKPQGLPLGL